MENLNNTIENIPHNLISVKPAAVWARVSTQDQRETSLPSQVSRCKERLEDAGYSVTHIFQADWTSLDLYSCPQFQELRGLIKNREIEALAVFDRDRLEAKGLQRLVFLSECNESGCELILCQGPPILAEPEGQLVELALAIGKERSVMRARQGSRDGLYDRATKYGKPVTYHKLYGYKWDRENNRLTPNDNWFTVKLIFNMLLKGSSYHPIIQELKKRAIPSPSGQSEWNKCALSNIAHNPAYAGRYFALKGRAVEPKNRRIKTNGEKTYGNSSVKRVPLEDAHYMPGVKIESPPISWAQRGQILDQLAQHQKLAQRNAKRNYLLRGRVFCGLHYGKNGAPRRYHGIPKHNTYYYACPVGGCFQPYILGPALEKYIKLDLQVLLLTQPEEFHKTLTDKASQKELKGKLKKEINNLEIETNNLINKLARLQDDYYDGRIGIDEYQRLKARYTVRRQWIKDRQAEILDELAQLGREIEAMESFNVIKSKYAASLVNGLEGLSQAEWCTLFAELGVCCFIKTEQEYKQWQKQKRSEAIKPNIAEGKPPIFLAPTILENQNGKMVPTENLKDEDKETKKATDLFLGPDYVSAEFYTLYIGLPLNADRIKSIVFSKPEHG